MEMHLIMRKVDNILWAACPIGTLKTKPKAKYFTEDVDQVTCGRCKRTRFYKDKVAQGLFKDVT